MRDTNSGRRAESVGKKRCGGKKNRDVAVPFMIV